jgi:hypothetical protein
LGTGKQLEFDGTATIIDKNNSGGGADEILTRAATGGGLDWRGLGLINGQSLLNGDITINSGITGTGSAGRVAFWTGVSTQSNSNNLFWDNSASRLGIGTLTPSRALDNAGASRLRGAIYDSADSPGTTGQVMTSNGASAWTWNTPPTNSVIVATNIVNFTTTVTGQRVLELSQTDINTGGFTFDNANDYITINATGVYEVTFSGNMGNDVAASNIWFQRWNGTTWDFLYGNVEGRIPMIVSAGFDYPTVYITSITNLNNGDRIRVVRNHSSGHTLHHMTSHLKIKRIS